MTIEVKVATGSVYPGIKPMFQKGQKIKVINGSYLDGHKGVVIQHIRGEDQTIPYRYRVYIHHRGSRFIFREHEIES